jgi:hypothetical protein
MRSVVLETYVRSLRKRVPGWLSRVDAEIYRAVLRRQSSLGYGGSVAEIGVHHGKSFVALALGLEPGEQGYCIDIFEDQHLNKDHSGKGDRAALEANLRRFNIEGAVIRQASSFDVTADEILAAVGKVRFFSVDGGHWLEIVQNDLALAAGSLAEHGVIALDDFHRAEWPDVSAGLFAWHRADGGDFAPFAIGFNKLYLCRKGYVPTYRAAVTGDRFLKPFVLNSVDFMGEATPVLNEALLPEFSYKRRFLAALKIYDPDLYLNIKSAMKLFSGVKAGVKSAVGRRPARA